MNAEPLYISTIDDSAFKYDSRASWRTLKNARKTSSRRHKSRTKTARKRYKPSVRDMTITTRGFNDFFGIKGYKTPKNTVNTWNKDRSKISNFNRSKILSIFAEKAEEAKKYPSPTTYASVIKWDKAKIKGGILNKTKKISCIEEILIKSKDSPGVGKYKWNKPFKLKGYSGERTRKTTFMDEAKALSKLVPGHKYFTTSKNKYGFSHSKILKNSPNYSFSRLKQNKEKVKTSSSFIRKDNGILVSRKVAPGYYKAEDSFSKTQVIVKNKYKFNKNKDKRYFDQILDNKKGIPGVGHYIKLESAMDNIISRPVTAKSRSLRRR